MPDQAIACICRLALGVQLGLDLGQFDQRRAVARQYAKAQYARQMGAAPVILGAGGEVFAAWSVDLASQLSGERGGESPRIIEAWHNLSGCCASWLRGARRIPVLFTFWKQSLPNATILTNG